MTDRTKPNLPADGSQQPDSKDAAAPAADMISPFDRPPPRAQQWLARVLSVPALLGSGALAIVYWATVDGSVGAILVAAFFSLLCVASALVLYRSLRTAPSGSSSRQKALMSWVLLVAGFPFVILALLPDTGVADRLVWLAVAIAFFSWGFSGISRKLRR